MSANDASQGVSSCYVFKSRLQEYAQKLGLSTPLYETIKEGPSHEPTFRSTVILNDVRYDSLRGFFNRKAAEQSAAEVALMTLTNDGDMIDCISQPVHETGLCKNLLQEYAQKMHYAIPSYEFQKTEEPGKVTLFTCTANIGGIKYVGAAAKSKRDAEIKAARTALLAIQSTGSSSNTPENPIYTVVPCRKKAIDSVLNTCSQTTPALKPKKRRCKKKKNKKKQTLIEKNTAQIETAKPVDVHVQDQVTSDHVDTGQSFVCETTLVLDNKEEHQIPSLDCSFEEERLMDYPISEIAISHFEISSFLETDGSTFGVNEVNSILEDGEIMAYNGEGPTTMDAWDQMVLGSGSLSSE